MLLITNSYFRDPLLVVGIDGQGDISDSVRELVDRLITTHEKEYLITLLGQALYDELIVNIDSSESKWTDLIAQLRDADNLISPIANYVYFYYVRTKWGRITKEDQYIFKQLQMDAWNSMVDMSMVIYDYLITNKDTYSYNDCGFPYNLSYINSFGI